MKLYITCFLLMINPILSLCQGRTIKTTIPCSYEILYKTPGKWFKGADVWQVDHTKFNATQQQEVRNRVSKIHEMMLKIYPNPKGVDVAWHQTLGYSTFADQVTFIRTDPFTLDRLTVVERPAASFGYVAGFFRHFCATSNVNEIWSGYPGETGTWLTVGANSIGAVATEILEASNNMLIGGYPIHLRQPLKEKFDGYELFYCKANVFPDLVTDEWRILIHRKGELPYTPVTRKQYLDQAIIYLTQFYDDAIKDFEQVPMRSIEEQEAEKNTTLARLQEQFANDPQKLKANVDYYLSGYKTDQQIREERVAGAKQNKEQELKKLTDEMDKSKYEGLLNSPAMIRVMYSSNLAIFETDPAWGSMAITENPDCIRKNLPNHVPQLLEINLTWNPSASQEKFAKIFQERFPTDKLQEMIDK